MIKIRELNQFYGKKQVLKDINLDIQTNKITALVGANGAGKSTLLNVVARLIPKETGNIFIDEINMDNMKQDDIAKKMAVLKQSNNLGVRLTVKELVSFGRFPYSKGRITKEDNRVIEESLSYMNLKDIENDYIDKLSGGQRQRVFIAMILAQDTPYILLDEPLNNLDMKHSVEMMLLLDRLVKELGKTILIVVHDINIAAAFADHIVAMKDGEIVEEGNPDTMIDKEILDHVFNHDFCIAGYKGRKMCVYYNDTDSLIKFTEEIEELN